MVWGNMDSRCLTVGSFSGILLRDGTKGSGVFPLLSVARSVIFFLCIIAGYDVRAAIEWKSDVTLSPSSMSYTGPADSIIPGQIIGSSWSTTVDVTQVFYCGILWPCDKSTMQPSSTAQYAGFSTVVDGLSYAVFETGVPGVGYIIGLKDHTATVWSPLTTGTTQTFPVAGTPATTTQLGWTAKVTFVKTTRSVMTGSYSIPRLNPAVLTAWWNTASENAQVYINPFTITFTASGCRVNTPDVQVNMGLIDGRTLSAIGDYTPSKPFTVTLNCDAGVNVYAVMSDQSSPGNTTQTASLTPASTASGIGVQFFFNGSGPLSLGADSSAAGATGQFLIQNNVPGGTQTLPFQARYIRTGSLNPGTANALAGITFSYQ